MHVNLIHEQLLNSILVGMLNEPSSQAEIVDLLAVLAGFIDSSHAIQKRVSFVSASRITRPSCG